MQTVLQAHHLSLFSPMNEPLKVYSLRNTVFVLLQFKIGKKKKLEKIKHYTYSIKQYAKSKLCPNNSCQRARSSAFSNSYTYGRT